MFQCPEMSIARGSTALPGFSLALAPFATAPAAAMAALAGDAGDVLRRPGEAVRENCGKWTFQIQKVEIIGKNWGSNQQSIYVLSWKCSHQRWECEI